MTKRFVLDALERAGKTFVQAYLALWMLRAGFLGTDVDADAAAFDVLFTLDNVKAGIVGVALSIATSVVSKPVAAPDSASLLPADVDPPQP